MRIAGLLSIFIMLSGILSCDKNLGPDESDSRVILKYEITSGWSWQKKSLDIYTNSAIKDSAGIESTVIITTTERKQINSFLRQFSTIKNNYVDDRTFIDADAHRLIRYTEINTDTIIVRGHINYDQVPPELQKILTMLKEKI